MLLKIIVIYFIETIFEEFFVLCNLSKIFELKNLTFILNLRLSLFNEI